MLEKVCMHYFISGHVQGVWYRASAQEKARELGLTGWARNLPDGRVEITAAGDRQKLEEFYAWLQKGPPLAKVTEVIFEELEWQEFERFGVM